MSLSDSSSIVIVSISVARIACRMAAALLFSGLLEGAERFAYTLDFSRWRKASSERSVSNRSLRRGFMSPIKETNGQKRGFTPCLTPKSSLLYPDPEPRRKVVRYPFNIRRTESCINTPKVAGDARKRIITLPKTGRTTASARVRNPLSC